MERRPKEQRWPSERGTAALTEVRPAALLGTIALGAVAVIALWWRATPAVSGVADWLTNAGRLTGLGAGYAVVVLLGLMARVPAVERGVGADRLARWHSMGGRYTVFLVVAHALLITWGYALTDRRDVVAETVVLWTQYADVLMGTVAMLLLVGVGIASAHAARKRLRYETWLYIHFYSYLAIALAFSHQFATGAAFVDDPLARSAWAAMYLLVAVLLLWYRFLLPLCQSLRHGLRVVGVVPQSRDTTTVVVAGRDVDQLRAQPGQFFRWRFLARGLWWSANPYSLSAVPEGDRLRITVKHLGDHSARLRGLQPGTRVIAEGPYGAMVPSRARDRKVLLVAGGVGVTPLRALFERFSRAGRSVVMVYRASRPEDLLFQDELDHLAAAYGSSVLYAVGPRGSRADVARPGVLQRYVPDLGDRDLYVCGPPAVMANAIAAARRAGVPCRRIHVEGFSFSFKGPSS